VAGEAVTPQERPRLCRHSSTIDVSEVVQKKARQIEVMVEEGWGPDDAKEFVVLSTASRPIARALCERNSRFAASTHAICRRLYDHGRTQTTLPPLLYCHLDGPGGLAAGDAAWHELLKPDMTGFQGFTSMSLTVASNIDQNFTPEGFAVRMRDGMRIFYDTDDPTPYVPTDSPVVAFESAPPTEQEGRLCLHAAVRTGPHSGTFPPHTLFRLHRIACTKEEGFIAPNGVRVMQQLFIVRATYASPLPVELGLERAPGRFATPTLQYATRAAYIRHLADVFEAHVLTMAQEFERDIQWTDWRGTTYSARDEWAYCLGRATRREGCGAGVRDEGNEGLTPADFRARVNEHIRARRAEGLGAKLTQQDAELTLDEVIAVRLYSGPAFQPINEFLRQIATLTGRYRAAILRHADLTFCATVTHLCAAIRKLAAVSSPEEQRAPLYRGVRGELPLGFWTEDEHGAISATDTAFMSTSRNSSTPLSYLGEGMPNVLWVLRPRAESEGGYHCGADISLLSQFRHEDEWIFPPFTMMTVLKPGGGTRRSRHEGGSVHDERARSSSTDGAQLCDALSELCTDEETNKTWLRIEVLPTFV